MNPKTFRTLATPYQGKSALTSANKSLYSSDQENVSSPSVTMLFISSPKTSRRAASVPHTILPFNTVRSSVNSVSSFSSVNSYAARIKPLSLKLQKILVPKSVASFKTSVCIESSVSGIVSNGAVSDLVNTLQSCVALCTLHMQHSISNSKQVAHLYCFNSGDIYLCSLNKFSSFVIVECFPAFLSLPKSFLTSCYLSKVFS